MIKQLKFFIYFALLFFGLVIHVQAKELESLDRIIAIVNDMIITQSELNKDLENIKKQMQNSNIPIPQQEVLRGQILDRLINKKLQMQIAEHTGVSIKDDELEKAINTIATSNKLTTNELYQKVGEHGTNVQDYRKEIRDQLILQRVQQQNVASKITVTPQEVEAFMRSKAWQTQTNKEYHLEDILIDLPEAPSPQELAAAKKRAEMLIAKIRSGISFNEAAAAESSEKNALQGGDLGWRKIPEIPSAFAERLASMKANDLAGPIQTPNGFHIIRLIGVRNADKQPAPTRAQVEQLIFQRKFEENLHSWVTKIRSEAFINKNPEKLA